MRRLIIILILLLSCGPKFDKEKARQEITSLVSTKYQDWFGLTEGSEGRDSAIVDTVPKISQGDSTLERWWQTTDTFGTIVYTTFDRDTLAYVTVAIDLRGALHFSLIHDTTHTNQKKFMIDLATRRAIFYRDVATDSWQLKSVSWAEIISDTVVSPTVNIKEIEIGGTAYSATLDRLWSLDSILSFKPNDSITVKLTTYEDTTTAIAVLYAQGRRRFIPNGKDTWVSNFVTPDTPGHYRLVMSLINRKTFFDVSYPYDSNRWVLEYEVK